MKKNIAVSALILIIVVMLLFSACSSQDFGNSNSNLPDPTLFRQQDRERYFIELDDIYYCILDCMTYFSEKEKLEFYPLCNKPDCKHDNSNCNAYAGAALGYWKEHLYGAVLLEGEPRIFRMNLDGTEHTKIADLEQPVNPAGTAGGFYRFYVHNGYMYYEVSNEGMNALFRTELETGKTERLLTDLLHGETQFSSTLRFNEQTFYFVLYDEGIRTLYCVDTTTLEALKVREWPLENRGWSVYGNIIYYYASDRAIFCEYDLTTGEEKTFSQQDYHGGAANYDDDYIYLTTWDDDSFGNMGLSIFDRNYQFIQRIDYQPNQDLLYDAQDKLIFTDLPSQKATKYLPKSAIGTGEAELLSIEDPYSYR